MQRGLGLVRSVLGANVNTIQPTFDGQYYHASPRWHKNVLAFHFLGSFAVGYGGRELPPFQRLFVSGRLPGRDGRKKSKSLANGVDPLTAADTSTTT